MGKGDRRTKRGKIIKGSFGRSRPKKRQNVEALRRTKSVAPQVKAKDEEE